MSHESFSEVILGHFTRHIRFIYPVSRPYSGFCPFYLSLITSFSITATPYFGYSRWTLAKFQTYLTIHFITVVCFYLEPSNPNRSTLYPDVFTAHKYRSRKLRWGWKFVHVHWESVSKSLSKLSIEAIEEEMIGKLIRRTGTRIWAGNWDKSSGSNALEELQD